MFSVGGIIKYLYELCIALILWPMLMVESLIQLPWTNLENVIYLLPFLDLYALYFPINLENGWNML